MALYHSDIGLPDDLYLPTGRVQLRPSGHALREAQQDRYLEEDEDELVIPSSVTLTDTNLFEVETTDGQITKLCCRVSYDDSRDIVLVLVPQGVPHDPLTTWTVVTIWVNLKGDSHGTLNAGRYDSP